MTFDHHLDQTTTFKQCVEQALIRRWLDYLRRALHIFRTRIVREHRRHFRMRLQSAILPAELFRSQLECACLVANQSDLPLLHIMLHLDHLSTELGRESKTSTGNRPHFGSWTSQSSRRRIDRRLLLSQTFRSCT